MQPKGRDIPGCAPYSFGIVAKKPNTDWKIRLMAIKQRMEDERVKDDELSLKKNHRDIVLSKFHAITDKKCLNNKIRSRVNQSLEAVERELDSKRKRLHDFLLSEERDHVREIVAKAQKVTEDQMEQQRLKALEIRARLEAEESALAAEKRLQQYMNRCEELRTFREALNTKEVREAVRQQIEFNKRRREAEKEMDLMWENVAKKSYDLMVAYEEEEARKRHCTIKEINDILQNQIKGRQLLKQEEERLKMEERAVLEKEKERLQQEEVLAKREQELKKQKMFEEMEEVRRKSVELNERRKAQEKVLNDMFCQLIQQELEREKEKVNDNRSELHKETEHFRNHLHEMAMKKERAEAEAEELRAREYAKLEAKRHAEEVKKCEAALKLKEEVMRGRCLQIKAKEREKEEERKKAENEERLAELLRLEHLKLEEEEKREEERKNREYRMELAKQIEDTKLTLMKQCEEEERQLKEDMLKEEAYFNKVKDIIANQCSAEVHPFMKKLRGMAY